MGVPSQRSSLLFTVAAVPVLLILASSAALGSESIIGVFEGVEEDAVVNMFQLDVADDLTQVGSAVVGLGELILLPEPGETCQLQNVFEFRGDVLPAAEGGLADIRGTVEHFMDGCDGESPAPDSGEFEVTIQEDGSVLGTIMFSDEREPLRIAGSVFVPQDSTRLLWGVPLIFWMFAVALIVAVVATVVCVLKRRRIYGLLGVGLSILAGAFTFESREVDPGMFEDALLLVAFVTIVLPLTILVVVIAFRPGAPLSWWAERSTPDEMPERSL